MMRSIHSFRTNLILTVLLTVSSAASLQAQLSVKEGIPIDSLVRTYFIGGGAQVTNLSYRGFARGISYFNGTSSNLGIDEGVLLTTGWVRYAVGPNSSDDISYSALQPGDTDLSKLVGYWTFDAAVLEFDFIPYQDTVHFEYVFASEEYTEFVTSVYNDVFAFFISGPGIIGKRNIALIPGTTTPVSINTINHIDFTQYYVNNYGGQSIEYDGFTTVLRASAVVTPCQKYHLKLAIADVSDNILDSGVFLKAGSFDAGNQLAVVGIEDAPEGGCRPGIIEIQRYGNLGDELTVNFEVQGTASNGTDYPTIPSSVTFGKGQSSIRIPIAALKDSIKDGGEWVTIYIPDLCNTGLVRDSIRIFEVPELTLSARADTVVCRGDELLFEAKVGGGSGVFTYEWSGGHGNERTLALTPAVSGTYVFRVYDSLTGCELRDTVRVAVEELPIAEAGPDKVVCPGGITQIESSITGDSPPYQVVWSPMNGLSNPGAVSPEASPAVTTVYTMTVTSRTGCVSVDTVTVRVSRVVIDAGVDTTVCEGSGVRIGGQAAGGVPPYTYSWTPTAGISNPGAPGVDVFPTTTTTYHLSVRSSNGCVAEDSVTIGVSRIALDASPDVTLCLGEARRIGDTAWTTDAPVSHVWEPAEGLDNRFIPTPMASPDKSTTYILTATNRAGCVIRDTVQVFVNTLRIDAGTAAPVCPGDSTQLLATVLSGSPEYIYRWTPAEGLTATDIPDPIASPDKSTWYTLTVIDRIGCVHHDSVLVTVWPEASARISIEGSPVFCIGDSVDLDAGPGYLSYLWSSGATSRRVRIGRAGNYWVEVVSRDGCPAVSDTVEIIVTDKPAPRITGETALCAGAEGVYTVPDVPGATYTWGITGGTVIDGIGTSQVRVRWDVPGTFTVRIDQIFGSASCRGDTTITVTVFPNPLPVIGVDGPLSFCEGGSVTLSAPAGFAAYQWSSGPITREITVRSAGVYTVRVVTAEGCEGNSPPVSVTVYALPAPEIIAVSQIPVCEGGEVTLGLREDYASYLWSDGSRGPRLSTRRAGSYTVRVTTAEGCSADATPFAVTFFTLPSPEIVADGPLEFCDGDSVRIRTTEAYARYLWSTGESTSSILVRQSGSYSVQVWTEDDCEGFSNDLTVTVFPFPLPPSISRSGDTLISSAAFSYQWFEEVGNQRVPVADGSMQRILSVPDRRYWVGIANEFGCEAISNPYFWSVTLTPSATIGLPDLEANPGDYVVVDLTLLAQKELIEAQVAGYQAQLQFNASLLVPIGATPQGSIINGQRIIDLTGLYDPASSELSTLRFVAALGNAASTPLTIVSFAWDQPDVQVTKINGEFRLGICREGGDRLFDATGELALEPNHPNPFNSMTVITYEVIERGHTELFVMDMLGRRVATLLDGDVEPGRYQVAFDGRELSSGMYLGVLRTPTQLRMQTMKLIK